VDELDDDDDDVDAAINDRAQTDDMYQQHQQQGRTDTSYSEITRLTNVIRECAAFMTDFVQKIFDPS